MPDQLKENRALARQRLEALAWQTTPVEDRGTSGSRREVREGSRLVPLSGMTDFQLRRYIGPEVLKEAGDMARNGRGIYSGTAAQEDDYVIHQHGGLYHPASIRFYADRVGPGGTHTTIGTTRGFASLEDAIQGIRRDAQQRGFQSGIIFRVDRGGTQTIGTIRELASLEDAIQGIRKDANASRREEPDEHAARELSLYIENDYALVGAPNSQGKLIEKNLLAKIRKGTFDLKRSEDAFMYLMEAGAKKYAAEFGDGAHTWAKLFNKSTRELVAHEFATTFYAEHKGH